mgnify:CR=1 FL=1
MIKLIKIAVIINLLFASLSYSQTVDSSAVMLKAKLLTTSRYGLCLNDSIISDIANQKGNFLKSNSSNILLLGIQFGQKYCLGGQDMQILWIGDCTYYLAFNIKKNKFYRLGGFDKLDTEDFFGDLTLQDETLFDIDYIESGEIDFNCLKEYSKLSAKKKLSRPPCLPKCSEKLSTTLTVH